MRASYRLKRARRRRRRSIRRRRAAAAVQLRELAEEEHRIAATLLGCAPPIGKVGCARRRGAECALRGVGCVAWRHDGPVPVAHLRPDWTRPAHICGPGRAPAGGRARLAVGDADRSHGNLSAEVAAVE